MSKLLHAGFCRYMHSTLFWVCFSLSLISGLFCGFLYDFDSSLYLLPILISAVLISLTIGQEFSDGIFRNKIARGHTKGKIFLSEAILSLAAVTLVDLMHTFGIFLFDHEVFRFVDWRLLAWIWFCVWITTLAFSTAFVFVSCTVSKRAIASIINLLLVVLLYFFGFETVHALEKPEYNESIHIEINEAGESVPVISKEPNPEYVGDPLRTVLEITESISPYGQFFRCWKLFSPMFDLHYITEENKPAGTDRYDDFITSGKYSPPAEEVKAIERLPFDQAGLILVLLVGGYILFVRKDFR